MAPVLEVAPNVWCPGLANPEEHLRRDYCDNCGPWWEHYPVCPNDRVKLLQRKGVGRSIGQCPICRELYSINRQALPLEAHPGDKQEATR